MRLRHVFCILTVALSTACYIAPIKPAPPLTPTSYVLQLYVVDDANNTPLTNARVHRSNVLPAESVPVGPDGGVAWALPPSDFNVFADVAGYDEGHAPVPLHSNLSLTIRLVAHVAPPVPVPTPPSPTTWTKRQLQDIQGDLMFYAPDIACETNVNCAAAAGLRSGWHWTLWFPRATPQKRDDLLTRYHAAGATHIAVQVTQCVAPDSGYHDLAPVTSCDGAADQLNTYLHEVIAHHLIPICAGVGGAAAQAGLDKSLCPIAIDNWDDTDKKDCTLDAIAQTFPDALLYVELPDGAITPKPDSCSPQPFPTSGGAWIKAALQRHPNFSGVLYEVNHPDGLDANVQQLASANTWWRDVQQVLFETDTYWKFWDNLSVDDARQYNDTLLSRAPQLHGCLSGCSTHTPPSDDASHGHYDGELSGDQVAVVNAPDFRQWPVTTSLAQVIIGLDDVHVTFDKQATWPDVSFGVQYSIGLCVHVNGEWLCNAPIELWKGKPGGGGAIQDQSPVCGSSHGQVACNWWYDGRWGALRGYQPAAGEQIGVFVVAGDARNNISPVAERSDIVLVKLPAPNVAATYDR